MNTVKNYTDEIGTCKDCRFWHEAHRDNGQSYPPAWGRCRYNSPREAYTWPETNDEDWCGCFELRPQKRSRVRK